MNPNTNPLLDAFVRNWAIGTMTEALLIEATNTCEECHATFWAGKGQNVLVLRYLLEPVEATWWTGTSLSSKDLGRNVFTGVVGKSLIGDANRLRYSCWFHSPTPFLGDCFPGLAFGDLL